MAKGASANFSSAVQAGQYRDHLRRVSARARAPGNPRNPLSQRFWLSPRGRFEVWVTHMFVLPGLVGTNTASGEGLVLKAAAAGAIQMLARLAAA